MIFIIFILFFFSCSEKHVLTYEELEILIKKDIVHKVDFSNYQLNNESKNHTLLDEFIDKNYTFRESDLGVYFYYRNKNVLNLLKKHGVKSLKELNNKYKKLPLLDKIRYEIKYNPKYKYMINIGKKKNLDEILKRIIGHRYYDLIDLYFNDNYNFDKIMKFSYKNKYIFLSFYDIILGLGDKKIIKKFKNYSAKRACEILNEKCKKIIKFRTHLNYLSPML